MQIDLTDLSFGGSESQNQTASIPTRDEIVVSSSTAADLYGNGEIQNARDSQSWPLITPDQLDAMVRASGLTVREDRELLREGLKELIAAKHGLGKIETWDYADLAEEYRELRPEVIRGICRRGEVVNLVAPPKTGKSLISGGLAWCVGSGRQWLGYPVTQGRVLIIDNELHLETLRSRLCCIADELMIPEDERRGQIDVMSLRGQLEDLESLARKIHSIRRGEYVVVILDALYRAIPEGTNENENAAMTRLYNLIDQYAAHLDAAIFVIHHTSKGDQSGKGITDIGSGAGAISRAADTHLTIRPHVEDGHAVLEAVTRSFCSPDPITIKFDYPIWERSALPAEIRKPAGRQDQAEKDRETDREILDAILEAGQPQSNAELRKLTGFGESRVTRALRRLAKQEQISSQEIERAGKTAVRWTAV